MRHQIVDALTYGARCCIILGAVLAVGAGVASTAGRWEDEP
jgi:hypothetical protein